jgi:uncharacterized membrane protein
MQDKKKTDKEAKSGTTVNTNVSDILKMQERFLIRIPARRNPKLKKIIDRVNADDELHTLWQVTLQRYIR